MALAAPVSAAFSCAVSAGGSINFLTYDMSAPDATASAAVTLSCNHLGGANAFINWSMTLTNGSSGTCANRLMQRQTSPAAALQYNIYQNATPTIWGNAACGSFPSGQIQVNGGNPFGSATQTMRGVLPTGQAVPFGTYLDSLVLTISF